MRRRLLALNVTLAILSLVFAGSIVRTVLAKRPLPPLPVPKTSPVAAPRPTVETVDPGSVAYAAIAARNLFNPGRSETATAGTAAPVMKPVLHGVVIDGAKSRAFLEDPAIKRIAGYSVGDTVGGGTIEKIAGDRVVIARPEGPVEVLLQDPSKPKVAPVAVTAAPTQAAPGQAAPTPQVSAQAAPVPTGIVPPPSPGAAQPSQVGPQTASTSNQPGGLPQFRRRRAGQGQPSEE